MDFPLLCEDDSISRYQTLFVELWKDVCNHDCTKLDHVSVISRQFHRLMSLLHKNIPPNDSICYAVYQHNVFQLFSFVAYIRDIHNEHGYRLLYYSLLPVCFEYEPILTQNFIESMLVIRNNIFPCGSWRDICGLCNYLKNHTSLGFEHPLIDFLIEIMNKTLHTDWTCYQENNTTYTNVAKWVPRESSKPNNWLFERLVINWSKKYSHYLPDIHHKSYFRALLKCKTKYRKMVSTLSSLSHVVEQKLCSNNIQSIDPCQIPSGAFSKYWNVFMNQTDSYEEKHRDFQHRMTAFQCGHYILSLPNIPFFNHKIYATNLWFPQHIDKYVSKALRCSTIIEQHSHSVYPSKLSLEIDLLNSKWLQMYNSWSITHTLKPNTLPVIHVQCRSFHDPQLHQAIGRACLLAQSSNIKRILFSCHVPIWIDISHCSDFVSIIQTLYQSLRNEVWVNPSLERSLLLLGNNHPFSLYIIREYGNCSIYNSKKTYVSLSNILQNQRYGFFSE